MVFSTVPNAKMFSLMPIGCKTESGATAPTAVRRWTEGMRMYKSPIDIIYEQTQTQIEGDILKAIQRYGIAVDKNELIQALQYDRNQYAKGYSDGKRDAMNELVRCKDCTHCDPENRHCDHPMGTTIPIPRKTDDFCSYGERRIEDE